MIRNKFSEMFRNIFVTIALLFAVTLSAKAVGKSGMYQYSVQLRGYISPETGKEPTAYLWVPDGCHRVKAVMFAQQNMTEETIYKMASFRKRMSELGVALLWVAPAFTNTWDPQSGCLQVFDEMLTAIAYQSGHKEIMNAPIIPFGHSAQATMPWNFAAWNNDRTLCIISFHGDAPRTNLCGYGTANVEWGRTRNIDGIPGLMVEGEYEWWEARVAPALAFRMMYPASCISFLCDAGRGHFDCSEVTAEYIAKFIEKSIAARLGGKTLKKVNPRDGWLACRYDADLPANDGDGSGAEVFSIAERPQPAPYAEYKGDRHDAFWYFDREMAELTEARYAETRGKKMQYVGFEYGGQNVPYDEKKQGGMAIDFTPKKGSLILRIKAVYTDSTHVAVSKSHSKAQPRVDVISGPVEKIDDETFRIVPYEAGMDNPRRSFSVWLVAVGEGDEEYKTAVQPIQIRLPKDIISLLR